MSSATAAPEGDLFAEVKALLAGAEPVRWLFYGDSITHGAYHTFGARDYTQLFAERVRFEMGRTQDVVINTAISGNSTRQLLEGFGWRVAPFAPRVVFLMIGMNDCAKQCDVDLKTFTANLETLAELVGECGARLVYQTTCPILPASSPDREPYFNDYMNAVREAAKRRGAPLIDHEAFWRANKTQHYFWMDNAFHPNGAGHLAFAYLLYRALGIYDSQSRSCRFYFPGRETMDEPVTA